MRCPSGAQKGVGLHPRRGSQSVAYSPAIVELEDVIATYDDYVDVLTR
jgi:hypothetical protein